MRGLSHRLLDIINGNHLRFLLVTSRVLKKKGFGEEDGIIYVNPMKPKEAGERTAEAMKKRRHLSERVIQYVELERRVDDWAQRNVDAIVHARKAS